MKKPVLLYVDDDPNDLLLFEDACREAHISFQLATANDGEKALDYLQKNSQEKGSEGWPALVVLDIKMPRLSGFEVLESIRKKLNFQFLPVVIFTSSKHEVDVKRAYELGANSYLVKTVDFSQLVDVIKILDQYWIHMNQTFHVIKQRD